MKVRGVKVNYFLNITRTILTSLIGLFTLPYINKVLGVVSVGKYEYVNSIISYFLLFSALGIPMYGIRAIARVRDDVKERSKVTIELFCILVLTTIISYAVLFGILIHLDFLKDYKDLILILSPMILLTNFGFEWFFQGIEDQLYITIRFVIIKAITLILLFSLVKTPADYLIYAAIIVFSTVGSNIFNFIYIKKFVKIGLLKRDDLNIRKHIKGVMTIFLATVSISIYLQLDNTLLGYYGGDKHVGIYATANKLVRFAILFVITLGSVLLPRLSYLYDNNKIEEYNAYLNSSLKYILFFSIPICVLIYCLADDIIMIMAGREFIDAILPMKILSLLLPIIGIAYYLAFMIMYPQGKEKLYTILVSVSALISIILNIYLIPKYFELATSVVSVLVELVGVVLMIILLRKQLVKSGSFSKQNIYYFIGSLFIFFAIYIISFFDLSPLFNLIISATTGILLYILFLLIIKDTIIITLLKNLKFIYEKKQ